MIRPLEVRSAETPDRRILYGSFVSRSRSSASASASCAIATNHRGQGASFLSESLWCKVRLAEHEFKCLQILEEVVARTMEELHYLSLKDVETQGTYQHVCVVRRPKPILSTLLLTNSSRNLDSIY